MAAFCVSCGNPLADGARFCNKCGATQPAALPAPPVATLRAPASAVPASRAAVPAMKILIGILAFFMFLILAVAGSCVYIGYRVKQKAHEFSHSMGGDTKPYTGRRQPCAMLTTSEASPALGQTSHVGRAARHHELANTPTAPTASTSTSSTPGRAAASPWALPAAP